MDNGKGDPEKARYWQRTLGEAARSGMSIREFCRRRRLKESRFYGWQRRLKVSRLEGTTSKPGMKGGVASFALVSEEAGMEAGIELVLGGGRSLRIPKGVDEETSRSVRAALEPSGC
ncbi:MAG: IS66 family insertion sequence element accessory protein TnpA [Terriglobia bacterium]